MTKLAWATDVHLDHINDAQIINFAESLVKDNPDGVILSGDISTANSLVYHLSIIEKVVQRPTYFVCGNHDYYNGSIESIRKQMSELTNVSQYLKYLPNSPYIPLTQTTAIVGHDCWYDALNGDWKRSNFQMTDWTWIKEFADISERGWARDKVVDVAQKLAHQGVIHVHDAIKAATRYHRNIIVVSHVPPFKNSHLHEGKIGDDYAQPWFTCKMLGDMLLDASKAFPNVHFTVLAGHTHGKFDGLITPNLSVHVGGAEYGQPELQQLISVP